MHHFFVTVSHTKDMSAIILHFATKHKQFRIMEHDDEDDTTSNLVMELEEATKMVDEVPNPDVPINTDEEINDQLFKLSSPRVSVSRTGIAHMHMDQMNPLKKMDRKRLKENHADDKDCWAYQCEHFDALLYFLWKANGILMRVSTDGQGAYHVVCAQRHLEKHRNKLGVASIEKRTNDKKEGSTMSR